MLQMATCDVYRGDLDHFFSAFSASKGNHSGKKGFPSDDGIATYPVDEIRVWTDTFDDATSKTTVLENLHCFLSSLLIEFYFSSNRDALVCQQSTRRKVVSDYRDDYITDQTDFYDLPDLVILGTQPDRSPSETTQPGCMDWREIIVPIKYYTAEEIACTEKVVRRTQMGIFARWATSRSSFKSAF